MAQRQLLDVYGFYDGRDPPMIEAYPVRLPRVLSPTDLQTYKHAVIDASSEIRLLELLPPTRKVEKNSNDILKCRLHTQNLSQKPDFEALSYTWGEIERHIPLSIIWEDANGQPVEEALFATPQLMMALRRLRHPTQSRWLWVDQLCINQDDDVEKSEQIQLMGQIYSAARQVVIWLGEDPDYHLYVTNGSKISQLTGTLGKLLEETLQIMAASGGTEVERFNLAKTLFDVRFGYHVDTIQIQRLAMVKEVLQRPWFTRAWVFQEASFARHLRILYGATEVSFDEVKHLCDAIADVQRDVGQYRDTSLRREASGFEMMRLIQRYRNQARPNDQVQPSSDQNPPRATNRSPLLEQLLSVLRRVRCSNPRDLIFAFLAFQQDEAISAVQWMKMPVEDVWTHAAERIIKSSSSLDIFAALSGDKKQAIQLPSWVPYWADCFPYGRPIAAPGATSFRASRNLAHVWVPHDDPKKLRVRGKIIDEIHGKVARFQGPSMPFGEFMSFKHPTSLFLMWECRVQDLRGYYYDHAAAYGHHLQTKLQTAEQDLLRMCLADGALDARQPLGEKICDLLDLNAQADSIRDLRYARHRSAMAPGEARLVDAYEELEDLLLVAEHKQLFATTHFQHGMAPMGLWAGDKIAIIHGSRTPCVLRAVDEERGEYKVMSQCYLDGWMGGEPRANIPKPHPHQRWWEEEQDEFVLV